MTLKGTKTYKIFRKMPMILKLCISICYYDDDDDDDYISKISLIDCVKF